MVRCLEVHFTGRHNSDSAKMMASDLLPHIVRFHEGRIMTRKVSDYPNVLTRALFSDDDNAILFRTDVAMVLRNVKVKEVQV